MSAVPRPLPTAQPHEPKGLRYVAPAAALCYPFLLMLFHDAVSDKTGDAGAALLAAVSLLLAIVVAFVGLAATMRYFAIERPTAADLNARRVALISVAAPPLYTIVGVITMLSGAPKMDTWVVTAMWLLGMAWIAKADASQPVQLTPARPRLALIVAHGVAAALFIVCYLGLHLSNHLFGLLGEQQHTAVMKVLRTFYRSPVVEPAILGVLLFIMVSGVMLAWSAARNRADRFRAFQIASGVYLLVAITSHVNAVLYLARQVLKIESDWGFAIGAPVGKIHDPWSIRLLPYYLIAVFFGVSHPFAGLRVILIKHGVSRATAGRIMIGGTVFAGLLATVIILAMCGMRI
jgi:hypothetical protein